MSIEVNGEYCRQLLAERYRSAPCTTVTHEARLTIRNLVGRALGRSSEPVATSVAATPAARDRGYGQARHCPGRPVEAPQQNRMRRCACGDVRARPSIAPDNAHRRCLLSPGVRLYRTPSTAVRCAGVVTACRPGSLLRPSDHRMRTRRTPNMCAHGSKHPTWTGRLGRSPTRRSGARRGSDDRCAIGLLRTSTLHLGIRRYRARWVVVRMVAPPRCIRRPCGPSRAERRKVRAAVRLTT